MNEKVDMKEGYERFSFLFATVKWQDNNVIYIVYYVTDIAFMHDEGIGKCHIKALNTGHDGSISTGHGQQCSLICLPEWR